MFEINIVAMATILWISVIPQCNTQNVVTHCDITMGISSNVIIHYDVILCYGT